MFVTQRVPSIVYIAWGKICILALISFKRGSLSSLGSLHVVNISADWNSAFLSREDWTKLDISDTILNKSSFTKFPKQQGTILSWETVETTTGIFHNKGIKKKIYIYIYTYDFLAHNINTIVRFFAYENIVIGRSAYSLSAWVVKYILVCLINRIAYEIRKFIRKPFVIREKNILCYYAESYP